MHSSTYLVAGLSLTRTFRICLLFSARSGPSLTIRPKVSSFLSCFISLIQQIYIYTHICISYKAWLLCKEKGRVVFPPQMPYQQGDWELSAQRSKSPLAENGTEHFGSDYWTVTKCGGFQWHGFFFWPLCVTLLSTAGKKNLSQRGIQNGKMHYVK